MNVFDNLNKELKESINHLGIKDPTEIQTKSIPLIMEGIDVIGKSATGSGKTLAFGCGIVENVMPNGGIQALVLTPTRELAEQVKDSLKALSYKKLRITAVYGGVSINPQIAELRRAEVVVATPGRMMKNGTKNTDTINVSIIIERIMNQ